LDCVAFLDEVPGVVKYLKYTSYRFIKTDKLIIKVFSKKVVVQFREDIEGFSVVEVYDKATKRLNNYVNSFFIPGVDLGSEVKQLSRHYALLGTEIAKKYVREGKKLFIFDEFDGKERVRIDYSDKDKGGLPHYEFTHPVKSRGDSDANKAYIESIINEPHYLPGETKAIVDTILKTQEAYAYNIRLHLEVMRDIKDSLKEIKEVAKK
jgi:hypothetical protein